MLLVLYEMSGYRSKQAKEALKYEDEGPQRRRRRRCSQCRSVDTRRRRRKKCIRGRKTVSPGGRAALGARNAEEKHTVEEWKGVPVGKQKKPLVHL